MTFEELYRDCVKRVLVKENRPLPAYDPYHLDCLLHPEKYPPVIHTGTCENCGEDSACVKSCIFNAIVKKPNGSMEIDASLCVGCSACIDACKMKNLTQSRDILPAMKAVQESSRPAYALIAPAFLGQFENGITPGQLRCAFKELGFEGMVEVALFADILTLKEALEFEKNILDEKDYQLTSCCCPMWIAMIRKVYHELMPHVPGAVSPMIACGRTIKYLHSDAITIFIGPCIAKKAEAREADIADAVDYVLTFQEIKDVFEFANIKPETYEGNEKEHSSRAGRIYAHTGGVSEAVCRTVEQIAPNKKISVRTRQANGIQECKAMMESLKKGEGNANFFEGMGCVGGCVGGPKIIINREDGRRYVEEYGNDALYKTPMENPYVFELLNRLGFDTVEKLLEHSDIFTRTFS